MPRTPAEALKRHLELRLEQKTEDDIKDCYTGDCVILTSFGAYKGKQGVLELADKLAGEMPNIKLEYESVMVSGDIGFLKWKADSDKAYIDDGADSYHFREGKICVQTIHYIVKPKLHQ